MPPPTNGNLLTINNLLLFFFSIFYKIERFCICLCVAITLVFGFDVKANGVSKGEFNIKTNLLQDAVGTMSLGAEYRFSEQFSIDLMGAWNPWTFKDHMMYKQWNISPQFRWWPGNRGHFLGISLIGGEYNFDKVSFPFNAYPELHDYRFEGWMAGGGIAYGYRYDVSRHFALEATIGVGVAHVDYDKYLCDKCGEKVANGHKLYVGPMRTGFNLIYRIGVKPALTAKAEEIPVSEPRIIKEIVHDTIYIREPALTNNTSATTEVHKEQLAVRITYPLSSSRILPDFADNKIQLGTLSDFISKSLNNPEIRILSIDFDGYASLEGNSKSNLALSQRRAEALAKYIEKEFPTIQPVLKVRGCGEDWDTPDFSGKEELMKISDKETREAELRKIRGGEEFRELLRDQLPATRRVECVIYYRIEN